MNRLPFHVFHVIDHVHTFTLTRRLNGYEEVSITDIYRVLSNGYPMFAIAQRSGDNKWTYNDLKAVARLTPSAEVVKEILDVWRALFLTGQDETICPRGTHHNSWSKALDEFDTEGNIPHRVTLRGTGTNNDIGYAYCIGDHRMGIIRSELDACQFYHQGTASIMGTAMLVSHQPDTFHDTIEYLLDLHQEDFMVIIQSKVGKVWVDVEIVKGNINGSYRFNKTAFINQIK